MTAAEIEDLLDAYHASAAEWDRLQASARAANKVFHENHRLYKILRESAEGRVETTQMMSDPNVGVRLLAAAATLGWAPEHAVSALETLEAGTGLHASPRNTRSVPSAPARLMWTGDSGWAQANPGGIRVGRI